MSWKNFIRLDRTCCQTQTNTHTTIMLSSKCKSIKLIEIKRAVAKQFIYYNKIAQTDFNVIYNVLFVKDFRLLASTKKM